jgi:hypothetical protein
MPGTLPPQAGIQGFAAAMQAIIGRITSLEIWQRTGTIWIPLILGTNIAAGDAVTPSVGYVGWAQIQMKGVLEATGTPSGPLATLPSSMPSAGIPSPGFCPPATRPLAAGGTGTATGLWAVIVTPTGGPPPIGLITAAGFATGDTVNLDQCGWEMS